MDPHCSEQFPPLYISLLDSIFWHKHSQKIEMFVSAHEKTQILPSIIALFPRFMCVFHANQMGPKIRQPKSCESSVFFHRPLRRSVKLKASGKGDLAGQHPSSLARHVSSSSSSSSVICISYLSKSAINMGLSETRVPKNVMVCHHFPFCKRPGTTHHFPY